MVKAVAKPIRTPQVSHKVTDFFAVRKSIRKTKKQVLREQQRTLEELIRNEVEDGLECRFTKGKGRAVFATKNFEKGSFVVEYSGDFISLTEANCREKQYAEDETTGCYMYYFKYNDQTFCIDATQETGKLGRLVNHSRTSSNLYTKTILVDGLPRLVLLAKENIKRGQELLYDYGDRSRESIKYHPWLKD
ncbi:N-lysine methyltransferase KMT5A-A-like [Anthonomus grandis grandis]|uniref:N-lysine methyltransferase KMT5A-A-like n=1 Tax=Anthonomus grandis grandis TaxID=2921223 RepID=UPI002166A487|nr:N-lysine methyltransferase KMT5A-A-like [Anthonomus grandis grandis]